MYLVKNATLYTPKMAGTGDILVCGSTIAAVDANVTASLPDLEILDATGCIVTPGFIDQHIHLLGGGGDEGPSSRVPEITVSQLAACGTTTVVGVCGFDTLTKTMPALLAKVHALKQEGLSAWMYSGSYAFPPTTLTRSVSEDIFLVPEVLGIKIAFADRNAFFPTPDELLRLLGEIRGSGLIAGKTAVLHLHMGGLPDGFTTLSTLIDRGVAPAHIRPTHCARFAETFDTELDFMRRGGVIDLTSGVGCFTSIAEVLRRIASENIPTRNVTMSTDGVGRVPRYDGNGNITGFRVAPASANLAAVREAVMRDTMPLEDILPLVTANVARHLNLQGKGRIAPGMDADLCFFDRDLTLRHVMAMGRFVLRDGVVLAKSMFEEPPCCTT